MSRATYRAAKLGGIQRGGQDAGSIVAQRTNSPRNIEQRAIALSLNNTVREALPVHPTVTEFLPTIIDRRKLLVVN
jgi:predicted AAA+ superfamily ATPase